MAKLYGILAQSTPTLDTDTTLYTVPSGQEGEVKLIIAERGGAGANIRIWVGVAGAATANAQYMYYDVAISANTSTVTPTFTVKATDIIKIRASTSNVSFTLTAV